MPAPPRRSRCTTGPCAGPGSRGRGDAGLQSVWVTLRSPRGASGSSPNSRASRSTINWAGMGRASGASFSDSVGTGHRQIAGGPELLVAAETEDRASLAADDPGQIDQAGKGRTLRPGDQYGREFVVDDGNRAVLEIGVGQAPDRPQAGLLELERDLERGAEGQSAATRQNLLGTGQRGHHLGQVGSDFQHRLGGLRHQGELPRPASPPRERARRRPPRGRPPGSCTTWWPEPRVRGRPG